MKTYNEWVQEGVELSRRYHGTRIEIADWLLEGETLFPETYAQAVDVLKLTPETLSNYLSAARRAPKSVRPDDPDGQITISHLQAVAPLADFPNAQRTLLTGVASGQLDREGLREEVGKILKAVNPDTGEITDDQEADDDTHAGVITEWREVETLEFDSAGIFAIWHKLTALVKAVGAGHFKLILMTETTEREEYHA